MIFFLWHDSLENIGLCRSACMDVFKERARLLEALVEEERSKQE